jgi:hypothetical protein
MHAHHDTPYSAATSDTARADREAACSSRVRSRAVSRHRGGTCTDRSVNTRRAHRCSRQRYRSTHPPSFLSQSRPAPPGSTDVRPPGVRSGMGGPACRGYRRPR